MRVLNLECNEFGDEGISSLCPALKKCQNLESLNLKTNEIGNAGARKIAKSVRGVRARSTRILIISLKYYEYHCITHEFENI